MGKNKINLQETSIIYLAKSVIFLGKKLQKCLYYAVTPFKKHVKEIILDQCIR